MSFQNESLPRLQRRLLRADIDTAIRRVLGSGWYVLGPEVDALEEDWAIMRRVFQKVLTH